MHMCFSHLSKEIYNFDAKFDSRAAWGADFKGKKVVKNVAKILTALRKFAIQVRKTQNENPGGDFPALLRLESTHEDPYASNIAKTIASVVYFERRDPNWQSVR